jgi:holin-like protein
VNNYSLNSLLNHCYALFIIAIALLLGKLFAYFAGGLSGSLYGMIIFSALLSFGIADAKKIKPTIKFIVATMGVCFVPAGVGIMNHLSIIENQWLILLLMIIGTTFMVIAIVGMCAQRFFARSELKPHE